MGILANENAISAGGYTIQKSLRFRASASAYLSRTPAASSGRNTWTYSLWVKRGLLGSAEYFMLNAYQDVNNRTNFEFGNDSWTFLHVAGGSITVQLTTTQVFRDPSAWYHLVFVYDDTQATASNRMKMYVNGVQVTSFSTATYPAQNSGAQLINANVAHNIGRQITSGVEFFDGYMAEINMVSGQALTPSSFGSTNTLTGVWQPAKYTGTYGTNGFYLPFTNTSTTSTLVADSSGNGNNWTPNNISLTAGTTYDSMLDSPTITTSATQPVGNYCVLNPLNWINGSSPSQANLHIDNGGTSVETRTGGTLGLSSGKWYFETKVGGTYCNFQAGVHDALSALSTTTSYATYASDGQKRDGTTASAYGATVASGDTVGVAIDMDSGKIWFSKNNTWQASGDPVAGTNPAFSTLAGATVVPFFTTYNNGTGTTTHDANFGQRPFSYTPPTGFKALCTSNLPDSTIVKGNKYMDATTYTGTGSNRSVTNTAGFKPDLVWIKCRSTGYNHNLNDSVRGANNTLYSNATTAETVNNGAGYTSAFNSNGFSVSVGSVDSNQVNANGDTYVGWQWQAGQGTTSSNTSGSITSTVSVNATAGFSVVTYTGTGANATVGHGLGVAPKMVIVKDRTAASANDWMVWHNNLTSGAYYLNLNGTIAQTLNATVWNSTIPSSTVFSVGTNNASNQSTHTYVAYCFAEISGYSKAFSYTGNGSADGVFSYLGFAPKLILLKRTDTTGNWIMWDTVRNTYNVLGAELYPNLSNAEASATDLDVLSNGFKIRNTTAAFNASGGTYIGFAWASNPFKNSLAF